MEKYVIPENPRYRVEDMRKLQDRDPVSASEIVNPTLIEPILESIAHVHQQANSLAARIDLTIPAEGWQEDTSGGVTLDLPLEGVTETMTPVVTLSAAALETAGACVLRETCETLPGAIRFRAGSAPEADMAGELLLILPYGGPGGGIPAASAATDREVAEMLNAVFGGQ